MSDTSLVGEVRRLLSLMHQGKPIELGAIPSASPVLAFGDPLNSSVATLGLNPSNLEFLDKSGNELAEPYHRFESLTTLQASDWNAVSSQGVGQIWQRCEGYFQRNPYDQWFKQLERILVDTGASYYATLGERACHLDLVPFATAKKWSDLKSVVRAQLIDLGTPSLVTVLVASDIRVLILNGATVVKEFSRLIPGQPLQAEPMPSWSLQNGRVGGTAYFGRVNRLGQFELGRELLVLGFNHNIQSSFGMTAEVKSRIASWIGQVSESALA